MKTKQDILDASLKQHIIAFLESGSRLRTIQVHATMIEGIEIPDGKVVTIDFHYEGEKDDTVSR